MANKKALEKKERAKIEKRNEIWQQKVGAKDRVDTYVTFETEPDGAGGFEKRLLRDYSKM